MKSVRSYIDVLLSFCHFGAALSEILCVERCRTMTDKPFGVNLTILKALIPADYDAYAKIIAEEKVYLWSYGC